MYLRDWYCMALLFQFGEDVAEFGVVDHDDVVEVESDLAVGDRMQVLVVFETLEILICSCLYHKQLLL